MSLQVVVGALPTVNATHGIRQWSVRDTMAARYGLLARARQMGGLQVEQEAGNRGGTSDSPAAPRERHARTRNRAAAAIVLAVTLAIVLPPLFTWQSVNQRKALSLTNMRRIATGCLTYSQDWDDRFPPPAQNTAEGYMLSWPRLVRPYVLLDEAFSNPSNPVYPFQQAPLLHDPRGSHGIDTSYALNRRFWGEFARGPFPVGNLELPEQTVLLVEAGRMATDPRHAAIQDKHSPGIALDLYGDMTDRANGLSPYPSVHAGQSVLVAADGHGIVTRILYYGPGDGPHDRRLGRVAESVYNWNGGHPNGETDTPAHE